MATKAELEQTIADLQNRIFELDGELREAENKAANSFESVTGLRYWVASNDKCSPVCVVSGSGAEDSTFTLSIYTEGAKMMGAIIGDTDGNTIASAGWIPGEITMNEIRYARGETIFI